MRAHLIVGLTLASIACATGPDVEQLCGAWASGDLHEYWWMTGNDLRGVKKQVRDGEEHLTEVHELRRSRDGHIYVAHPGDAPRTEFAPIDPQAARFAPEVPAAGEHFAWANYAHEFPQEIHYVLVGDRLAVTITGPGRTNGWEFQRTVGCPSEGL